MNPAADADPAALRISLDTKATVKIGLFSRGGRNWVRVEAADHDFKPLATLTPFGVLVPQTGELALYFATSRVTSDFIADMLGVWWERMRGRYPQVRRLVLNQDNGPENHSRRTQFLKRLVGFAREYGVDVELAHYPPYHSKYNPIERCWGALEQHWNGTTLDDIPTALRFAETMTWHGQHPLVCLIQKSYRKGVRLSAPEMEGLERQVERLPGLEKWFVRIRSQPEQ